MADLTFDAVANYYDTPSSAILSELTTTDLSVLQESVSQLTGYDDRKSIDGTDIIQGRKVTIPIVNEASSPIDSTTMGATFSRSGSAIVPVNYSMDDNVPPNYSVNDGVKDSSGNTIPAIVSSLTMAQVATMAGCRLGLAIDDALYENAPDFWESAFGSVSPNDFRRAMGETSLGRYIGTTLFGITDFNSLIGNYYVTPEMLALAYMALRDKRAFDPPTHNYYIFPMYYSGYTANYQPFSVSPSFVGTYRNEGTVGVHNFELTSGTYDLAIAYTNANQSQINWVIMSKTAFSGIDRLNDFSTKTKVNNASHNTINGKHLYAYVSTTYSSNFSDYSTFFSTVPISGVGNPQTPTNSYGTPWQYIYMCLYQSTDDYSWPVEGISQQGGTSVYIDPTIVNGLDLDTVMLQLRTNFPFLFDGEVSVGLPGIDPVSGDPTIIEQPFVPLPVPYDVAYPTPDTEEHPTTGDTLQPDITIDGPNIPPAIVVPGPAEEVSTGTEPIPEPEPGPAPEPAPTPDPGIDSPPADNPPGTGEGEDDEPYGPPIPDQNATALWKIYNPSAGTLDQFGAWLWSSNFVDQILRIFQSPMDAIIGIHAIYCTPNRGGTANIVVGYLDSGIATTIVAKQYTDVDCGSVFLPEYFGNVFDYDPYTRVSIFLPFIGAVPLKVSEVMRSTITVKYRVDVLTGACLASITISRDGYSPTMYTFGGDCAARYPISGGSYSGIITSIASSAMSALGVGLMTGGAPGTAAMGAAAAGATFARTARLEVQHSGGFSGNSSVLGPKKPYLIVERPIIAMAGDDGNYAGYPANKTTAIGAQTGFVKCKAVHLKVAGATKEELDEIERLLMKGILV